MSTMLPLRISLPMISAAALGAEPGVEKEKVLHEICWPCLCLTKPTRLPHGTCIHNKNIRVWISICHSTKGLRQDT